MVKAHTGLHLANTGYPKWVICRSTGLGFGVTARAACRYRNHPGFVHSIRLESAVVAAGFAEFSAPIQSAGWVDCDKSEIDVAAEAVIGFGVAGTPGSRSCLADKDSYFGIHLDFDQQILRGVVDPGRTDVAVFHNPPHTVQRHLKSYFDTRGHLI